MLVWKRRPSGVFANLLHRTAIAEGFSARDHNALTDFDIAGNRDIAVFAYTGLHRDLAGDILGVDHEDVGSRGTQHHGVIGRRELETRCFGRESHTRGAANDPGRAIQVDPDFKGP